MTEQHSGRPAVGETVRLDALGECEVLSSDDPSLVTLKRPNGATLKIGERALAAMLEQEPAAMLRAQEAGE